MEFIDYYEILQVHPKADPDVIAKAYRTLIAKHHPDRGGDGEVARLLNAAYEVLSDPDRRASYNLDWGARSNARSDGVRNGREQGTRVKFDDWPAGVRRSLGDAVSRYDRWVESGCESGQLYAVFLEGLDRFRLECEAAKCVDRPWDDLFPLALDTPGYQLIALARSMGEIPPIGSGTFPPQLIEWAQAAISGRSYRMPGGVIVDARRLTAEQLWLFLSVVALYFPEHVDTYVSAAKIKFNVLRHWCDIDKLYDIVSRRPVSDEDLAAWLEELATPSPGVRAAGSATPRLSNPAAAELIKEAAAAVGHVGAVVGPRLKAGFAATATAITMLLIVTLLASHLGDGMCGALAFGTFATTWVSYLVFHGVLYDSTRSQSRR